MVRGSAADQERAVGLALDAGINYFDTAPVYGNGESEKNLGRVLAALKPKTAYVGTKVNMLGDERKRVREMVTGGLEASLKRLGRDSVDLFQLHNTISSAPGDRMMSPEQVLDEVVPAMEALRKQGKTRFIGLTAVGETPALHKLIDAKVFDTAQVSYNLLNPSAGRPVAPGYPAQDYGQLLARTRAANMGVINIRVLAGGALSATAERHPIASPAPAPIGSGSTYDADLARAQRLLPLVKEGHAGSLVEASIRYVISNPDISTVLVGMATIEQFDSHAAAIAKGPLSAGALARAMQLQDGFAGEDR
jgi:L-galactose dehydrogenase/L-glyceraldehyde 3-phosphate reductase